MWCLDCTYLGMLGLPRLFSTLRYVLRSIYDGQLIVVKSETKNYNDDCRYPMLQITTYVSIHSTKTVPSEKFTVTCFVK
jgi:hypothetical protein